MRFLRKPPLLAMRKKFHWLPRKSSLIINEYLATGASSIPYTPGFHNPYGLLPGQSSKPKKGSLGGMVTPVESKQVLARCCWMWLEYEVQQLQAFYQPNNTTKIQWAEVELPKQWNVFYEYD